MLFVYLLTSPHSNSAGYYRLPLLYASHDLGKGSERVSEGLRNLSERGFIAYDEGLEVVLIRNFLKYNQIQNQNQAKGTAKVASSMPDGPLLLEFLECVEAFAYHHKEYFEELYERAKSMEEYNPSERVSEGFGKGLERVSNTKTKARTKAKAKARTNTCASTEEVDSLDCNDSQVEDVEADKVTVQSDESTKKPRKPFRSKRQEQLFDEFWERHPKKRSKGRAEKAWVKIKPDEQLFKAILDGLERAKTSVDWLKDDGQYIPYPSTWLNAKGWEDEYPQQGGGPSGRDHVNRGNTPEQHTGSEPNSGFKKFQIPAAPNVTTRGEDQGL